MEDHARSRPGERHATLAASRRARPAGLARARDGYRRRIDQRLPSFIRVEAVKRLLALGRSSPPLWWYPGWSLLLGILAGAVLSRFRDIDAPAVSFLVYDGGADAARSFVSLVATSLATITTLTLTLTVVSIQLASSQYSPRLIEHYLNDRTTHVVFSLFLGTFAFSIATLLNIRLPAEDAETGKVPGIAISILVVLVVLSLVALVFFVHRVTTSMRVESILQRVRNRTFDAIGTRDPADRSDTPDDLPRPPDDVTAIRSRRSGFYAAIDRERCRSFRPEGTCRVWVVVAPGDFVVDGTPVALVEGEVDDELVDTIEQWLEFDEERWIESDFSYGIRNLTDVALKGLSPGVNDPTTATMAIHRIGEAMAEAGRSHPERMIITDAGTEVYVAIREWGDTLDDAVRQIAEYGRRDLQVVVTLVRMLCSLAWTRGQVDRRDVIGDVAERLRTWVDVDVDRTDDDCARIEAEFELLDAALRHEVRPGYRHLL